MNTQDRKAQHPCPIHTVGVRFRDRGAFAAAMRSAGIDLVADVRSSPRSRWLRDFNRKALEGWLPEFGLEYLFLGKELGGRSLGDDSCFNEEGRVVYSRIEATEGFRDGIRLVLELSRTRRLALMCACRDHLHCHRGILVARHLVRRHGADVRHFVHSRELGAVSGIEGHLEAEQRLVRQFLDGVRRGRAGGQTELAVHPELAAEGCEVRHRNQVADLAYLARERAIAYRRKPAGR